MKKLQHNRKLKFLKKHETYMDKEMNKPYVYHLHEPLWNFLRIQEAYNWKQLIYTNT